MKIDFEFENQYGKFLDSIVLPDNHNLSDEDIEAIKQARINQWIIAVSPPPILDSTVEDPGSADSINLTGE